MTRSGKITPDQTWKIAPFLLVAGVFLAALGTLVTPAGREARETALATAPAGAVG